MRKLKIAATGLEGLVGSRLHDLLNNKFEFISIRKNQMDITNEKHVDEIIAKINFDIFIHLAAYTNADLAEIERETAWTLNVKGTQNVYQAVKKQNKKFIYISTDHVFDGVNPPFFEDSPTNPLNYYGMTKHEGEKIVSPHAMIVRISYPYRANFAQKKDFVRSIIDLLKQKKSIKGVVDQYITPTFIDDIAYAFKYLFENFASAIYHIVGSESLSAYEAIMKICDVFALDKNLVGQTTHDDFYKGKATRPKNDIIKSKKNNFYKMCSFQEGLVEMKKQLDII